MQQVEKRDLKQNQYNRIIKNKFNLNLNDSSL